MTRIKGSSDCGNPPKNRFVQDVALMLESDRALKDSFAEDVALYREGHDPVVGDEAVSRAIRGTQPDAIEIHHAVTHGKVGAANGITVTADGRPREFCYVLEFTSTKASRVQTIRRYGAC